MSFAPKILQYAWVVPNLEEAARRWHGAVGVGPFLINRDIKLGASLYRGHSSTTHFSTAVAQHGDVQIELVEQLDDTASAYRDTVAAGRTGFHHIAFIADDYDADLAHYTDRSFAIASSGDFAGLRFAYVDTSATLGHMTERLEDKPTIRAFFGAIRKSADRWDGDPATLLRELG